MKKIVLLSFSFASLYAAAQNVKLEVGKTFKTTTTIESVSEMMGQENTTNVTSTSNLKIVSLDKNLYKGNSTLAKMTMTGSMMGQDINFDSDKKADMDSQIGQMLGGAVGKATEFTIDKNTGEQKTIASAEKEESGAMGGLMGGSGSEGNQNIFFVDAISKKVGEKWSKTTDVDGLKTINNYEIITIKEGLITLSSNGTTKGSTTKSFGQIGRAHV